MITSKLQNKWSSHIKAKAIYLKSCVAFLSWTHPFIWSLIYNPDRNCKPYFHMSQTIQNSLTIYDREETKTSKEGGFKRVEKKRSRGETKRLGAHAFWIATTVTIFAYKQLQYLAATELPKMKHFCQPSNGQILQNISWKNWHFDVHRHQIPVIEPWSAF